MNRIYLFIALMFLNSYCQDQRFVERDPKELVCPERYDVLAKYLYARHHHMGIDTGWPLEVYKEHLKVWNNFHEPKPFTWFPHFDCAQIYKEKNNFHDYVTSFNETLDSIQYGFDPTKSVLPVTKNGVIMDGSHRLASALLYNQKIIAKIFDIKDPVYNSDYFKNKKDYATEGLAECYLDAMALEYIRLKKNTYIAIVFPCVSSKFDQIKNILDSYTKIVYQKDILLSNKGPANLIYLSYEGEPWLNSLLANTLKYFPKGFGVIKIFLLEADNLEKTKEAKSKIRNLFNIGNHVIHINDTHQETETVAPVLFSPCGIHWLCNATIKHFKNFERYVDGFKKWVSQNNVNTECLCIDTSAVMAAYGLRDCNDLDIISYNNMPTSPLPYFNDHNEEIKYHKYTKEEIIFDPRNYFYYKGLKFAALHVVKEMKLNRNEIKDRHDIDLINKVI